MQVPTRLYCLFTRRWRTWDLRDSALNSSKGAVNIEARHKQRQLSKSGIDVATKGSSKICQREITQRLINPCSRFCERRRRESRRINAGVCDSRTLSPRPNEIIVGG
ncbi:uncharacterized protein LOC143212192 [Lasioglossum baleicum]|uniref:uncharacterized protein LOC143212192 n=1 Tax=Lasioglossum baleicum TaxID=434251 RepID=UPI003FCEC5A9